MKKLILSFVAILAFGYANAQKGDMSFGVKAGVDMLSAKADGGGSVSTTGFFLGGFAEFGLADKLVLHRV